jgi:hypothetical protein
VLPERVEKWSLTSLQQRSVKTGGCLIKLARYCWLMLAESHLTRRLFVAMLRRVAVLPVPTGQSVLLAGENLAKEKAGTARCKRNLLKRLGFLTSGSVGRDQTGPLGRAWGY